MLKAMMFIDGTWLDVAVRDRYSRGPISESKGVLGGRGAEGSVSTIGQLGSEGGLSRGRQWGCGSRAQEEPGVCSLKTQRSLAGGDIRFRARVSSSAAPG